MALNTDATLYSTFTLLYFAFSIKLHKYKGRFAKPEWRISPPFAVRFHPRCVFYGILQNGFIFLLVPQTPHVPNMVLSNF